MQAKRGTLAGCSLLLSATLVAAWLLLADPSGSREIDMIKLEEAFPPPIEPQPLDMY